MKNTTLLLYRSQTGFTERYAKWIAAQTGCTLQKYGKNAWAEMAGYDTVIFGTRAHAGRIDGWKQAREDFRKSGAGRLILFVTGAMPDTAGEVLSAFWKQNLTEEEQAAVAHFYMPAGLCFERMAWPDRLMIRLAAAMTKRKKEKDAFDREFEQAAAASYDISSEEYIRPLLACLKDGAC